MSRCAIRCNSTAVVPLLSLLLPLLQVMPGLLPAAPAAQLSPGGHADDSAQCTAALHGGAV